MVYQIFLDPPKSPLKRGTLTLVPPLLSYPLPGSFLTFDKSDRSQTPNLNPPLMILNKIRVLSRRIR
jgi:hypothetical protein